MVEIGCLIVVGAVTWMVASEGVVGAAQVFLCTLLSALAAMNFFEPLAGQLRVLIPEDYCDFVALVGLFTGLVFALRMGSEQLAPSYIQVIPAIDTAGRWVFGLITGYLTMAFLLTSLHTAPLPREFMGFKPERSNVFGTAPDRQWLGFVQYISERPLSWMKRVRIGAKDEFVANAFDGEVKLVGDPQRPYSVKNSSQQDQPQVVWPSFPIRYATRRGRIGSNQQAPTAAAPIMIAPPTAPGGGGQPAGAPPAF